MENNELASSLRTAISRMNKRLRKSMNALNGLSITEIDTVSYLYRTDTLSPSELAELLKVRGQSMSEVLTRLQKLEMINKTPSLTDKRKFAVSLTEHGRQVVEQTRYERDEWLSNAIEYNLSGKEKLVLKEAIGLLERLSDFQ